MPTIDVIAIRGDNALGFLASVGLVSLSDLGLIGDIRIAFSDSSSPTLRVTSEYESAPALGSALNNAFQAGTKNGVLPMGDPSYPIPRKGIGQDPSRMHRKETHGLFARAAVSEMTRRSDGDISMRRHGEWLHSLSGQLTEKSDRGDIVLSPFYAPTGQMTLRGSVFDNTIRAVQDINGPSDSVTGWIRHDYDGANFDVRAVRDAGTSTEGKASNRGAPSATWLATMAIRAFTMIDDGLPEGFGTVGWQRIWLYPGYTRRTLVWPVWAPFLDYHAVRHLVARPELRLNLKSGLLRLRGQRRLRSLGIHHVFAASRKTLTSGDGPIGPAVEVWPYNYRP